MLGLDEGGACRGVAFRVAPDKRDATLAYLREREQITDVYVEAIRPVSLLDGSGRELEALVLRGRPGPSAICRPARRPKPRRAWCARRSAARASNIDYVLNTVRHLEEAGIHDAELMALAAHLAEPSG